jgi:hypothetical protein
MLCGGNGGLAWSSEAIGKRRSEKIFMGLKTVD